ncbi:LemA family protein [bacterium]|nr:LemA family protein [bacterium]
MGFIITLAVLVGGAVVVVLYVIAVYNKLVGYRVEVDNSWSQIDVQLKRRSDLIPNLVETVKGYMQHERGTLEAVVAARARATGATNLPERMKAEGEISGLLGRLLAVWENYPDLKANQNAMQLQEELTSTENRISYSRGHYNDVTANYNTLVQRFPSNIVAGMTGFSVRPYFQIAEAEKAVPQVKF